ncbi:MAG: MBL fold metallo-hydrolase [Deltaproteobacteria bacterium]|jgi:glyoxylase-like metal-dependent hydrolase (beta-lactamase superfamily II)|nr:MBL fold metallo-hydrolase [Deltaproteobacteria bacterium]
MSTIEPRKITDSFFQLGIPFFPVYLSLGRDAMLIDGGTGGTFFLVQEQLKEIGVDLARVKSVTLTHSHGDHIGLLPHLLTKWPHLKLLASAAAAESLAKEAVVKDFQALDRHIATELRSKNVVAEAPDPIPDYRFRIDGMIEDGQVLDLGDGIRWRVFATPGHSHCEISLLEEKEGTLVVGDTTGFYMPEVGSFWPNYFASLPKYCASLVRLGTLTANRIALGHRGVLEGDPRAFLAKALDQTRDYHQEMLRRTSSGEDVGKIAQEKAKWVQPNAEFMPYRLTEMCCQLLIKQSQKNADRTDLFPA